MFTVWSGPATLAQPVRQCARSMPRLSFQHTGSGEMGQVRQFRRQGAAQPIVAARSKRSSSLRSPRSAGSGPSRPLPNSAPSAVTRPSLLVVTPDHEDSGSVARPVGISRPVRAVRGVIERDQRRPCRWRRNSGHGRDLPCRAPEPTGEPAGCASRIVEGDLPCREIDPSGLIIDSRNGEPARRHT